MRRTFPIGVLAALLAATASAPAGAAAGGGAGTTGRLLVALHADGTGAHAAAGPVLARAGARRAGRGVPQLGIAAVRPARGSSARALAERLRADPRVASVEVERRHALRALPDDPALTAAEPAPGAPPGTPLQWWAASIGLPAAWEVARGAGGLVGVVDTGVDAGHPELAGRIAAAVDADATLGAGPATADEIGHGTHVASLACARAGNGLGLAGAGHDCALVVEKTDLSDGSIARSIVDAADRGAHAITLSFGTDGAAPAATAIVRAIDHAVGRGVVLVAAAADEPVTEQGDPANVLQPTGTGPHLDLGKGLSVTASTFDGRRAPFAGHGTQISLAAPGAFERKDGPKGLFGAFPAATTGLETGSVIGRMPPCGCRTELGGDRRYAYLRGTSMAVPIVAGVAALVRRLNPDLTALEVVRLLKQTARRPAGRWTGDIGWGIVDAAAAVDAARRVDRRPPASSLRGPRSARGRSVRLVVSASDGAPEGLLPSGVSSIRILRAAGSGPPRVVARVPAGGGAVRVRLARGRLTRLWSVAADRAGNREPRSARPRLTVRRRG